MSRKIVRHGFAAMGAEVEVQTVDGCADDATRIEALFAEHERRMSRFLPDSELCALNRSAGRPFAASPLLFDAVAEACGWACITDGVFDPTVIEALERAGYDGDFAAMRGGAAVIERPRATAGSWRDIAFDFESDGITLPRGARVDLGGIGKGYTVDRAIELLPPHASGMVNAGGDLYASGDGPDDAGWCIGVADPLAPDSDLAVILVRDRGVATSGRTKRRWQVGAVEYHHLIDAESGAPSESDLLSVTVIAGSATEADVLAKTAFLLGSARGPQFVERLSGCAALAVTTRGAVIASERFREYLA
jgi:thiamine biosynthesis lipoprotein